MIKSETGARPQIVTPGKTLNEIKDIAGQLSLKNLYSLLGCTKGLSKSQAMALNLSNKNIISIKFKGEKAVKNKGC